jgi:hypothetical protein
MGVIVRRDNKRGTTVKGNDCGGWSSDDVMLWLGKRQNGDPIEWWRRVIKIEMTFYSSEW